MAGLLTDAILTAVILLPGFLSFRIAAYIAHYATYKISDLQTTIFSLLLSIAVVIPTSYAAGVNTIDDAGKIFQPFPLVVTIISAAAIGVITGFGLRYTIHSRTSGGSPWDEEARKNMGNYAVVFTSGGDYYLGWIHRMSGDDSDKRELVLSSPSKLFVDDDGKVKSVIDLHAESILFKDDDIKRVFLDVHD